MKATFLAPESNCLQSNSTHGYLFRISEATLPKWFLGSVFSDAVFSVVSAFLGEVEAVDLSIVASPVPTTATGGVPIRLSSQAGGAVGNLSRV